MTKRTKRRKHETFRRITLLVLIQTTLTGCRSTTNDIVFDKPVTFQNFGTQIEYPDACTEPTSNLDEIAPPLTLADADTTKFEYWDLSLQEALQMALSNSSVIQDLGGRVLNSPQGATSVYDPALVQMNSRTGEEAALSAFDTQFATSLFFRRDENKQNISSLDDSLENFFPAQNHRQTNEFQAEFAKTAATGTQLFMRNITVHDDSSQNRLRPFPTAPGAFNRFYNTFTTVFEGEVRHPLLRGGGVEVNRIAGTGGGVGAYNGIVIARINTDIALADFERSIRDFVNQVQQTYWRLYFAYRNLDAQRTGLEAAQEAWRNANVQFETGTADGTDEARASQQFFDFQQRVQNALSGSATITGVLTLERDLRLLIGQNSDGRLIRPSDSPTQAETLFDWSESLFHAVNRRVELRRQRWQLKSAELQLLAARNLLLPQFDLVALYQFKGFGDDLLGNRGVDSGSAFRDLYTGDLQSWNLGAQFSVPLGRRLGHVGVREANLNIMRARAILEQQERSVTKELQDALGELARSYAVTRTNVNKLQAAQRRYNLEVVKYKAGEIQLNFVLDALSEAADASSALHSSFVDYSLAIAEVHRSRGTFLDYMGVELSEGGWTQQAYFAAQKEGRRFTPREFNYTYTTPGPVTKGAYPQHVLPRGDDIIENSDVMEPTPAEDILEDQASALPSRIPLHATRIPMHRDDLRRTAAYDTPFPSANRGSQTGRQSRTPPSTERSDSESRPVRIVPSADPVGN